ncbi:hypothetical protein SANT12839_081960 [Streptomyces antimycoticus]|uniref:Uncharacterized protein n=1 Tax=Streptomyces antimycoticus TaxID=68175 RepID=A0A4D4KGK7_9ACTN|nr:hypothetical protein SANT12839_081960 [Streptomyces antimycoticus]
MEADGGNGGGRIRREGGDRGRSERGDGSLRRVRDRGRRREEGEPEHAVIFAHCTVRVEWFSVRTGRVGPVVRERTPGGTEALGQPPGLLVSDARTEPGDWFRTVRRLV